MKKATKTPPQTPPLEDTVREALNQTEEVVERKANPDPSVGRTVHYIQPGQKSEEPLAAVIARVNDDNTVTLAIFNPNSANLTYADKIPHSDKLQVGAWSWPERKKA